MQLADTQERHAQLDERVIEAERKLSECREQQRSLERRAQEAQFSQRSLDARRAELTRMLREISPDPDDYRAFLLSTGSEATQRSPCRTAAASRHERLKLHGFLSA
jgi:chromosome segregation ATPase